MDHKIFSTALIAASSLHAAAHYFNNRSVYLGQSGITGMLMLSSITILPVAGMIVFNRFGTVLRIHQAGAALFLGAYLMHTSDYRLIKYAMAAAVPFAIDRFIENTYYTHPVRVIDARIAEETDFISLELSRPAAFKHYRPGQYALLSFQSVDALVEPAHPFTIAQVEANKVRFMIKRTGEWTNKLYEIIQSQPSSLQHGHLVGPFGYSLLNLLIQHAVMFISSGIGITPMMAVLNYVIHADKQALLKPFSLLIVQRDWHEAKPCIELLDKIPKENGEVVKSIDVYLTRQQPDPVSIKQLMTSGLFANKTNMHVGRPDFNTVIKSADAVSVCGSHHVIESVTKAARRLGKICHSESF
jgi:predicted ferric reductase